MNINNNQEKSYFVHFFNSPQDYEEHFTLLLNLKLNSIENENLFVPFFIANDTLHLLCEILQTTLSSFPKYIQCEINEKKDYIDSLFYKINFTKNNEFTYDETLHIFLDILISTTKSICYQIIDNKFFTFFNNLNHYISRKSLINEIIEVIQNEVNPPKIPTIQFMDNYKDCSKFLFHFKLLITMRKIINNILTEYLKKTIFIYSKIT